MPPRVAIIDLITRRPADDAFILVAVEEGPWEDELFESHRDRLELRLRDYIQCIVSGGLADEYPESYGKPVVVRLNCFGTPDALTRAVFQRLEEQTLKSPEVHRALESRLVARFAFEYNWRRLPG
jgi:hypothetical protein